MELVRGVPITDYCEQKKLHTKQRFELFILVCQAVQHAHQKGIIHRDLKPSNILVSVSDGKAVPKVIDFGVAKATQRRLTDATIYTPRQDPDVRWRKLRFFSGMDHDEIAALLGVNEKTVRRHWELAKIWLYRAIEKKT